MALRDAQRLFDILVRLQIFVEGVKAAQAFQFNAVMNAVNEEFKKLLSRINYPTLDALTKSELNKLVITLRGSQNKVYSTFTTKVFSQLKEFMKVSVKVNRIVYASTFNMDLEDDDEVNILGEDESDALIDSENDDNDFAALFGIAAIAKGGTDALWSKISNAPMGANGILILPFVKAFSTNGQLSTENIIRKGYSNAWTPQETVKEAVAQVARTGSQFDAISHTAIQHIQAMVSASIASALYGKYRWISVIDSGTTDICRRRDQHIYEYGKGPMPPAHVRCRSITMPYLGPMDLKETFYSFIKRQSGKVQNVALGRTAAEMLRAGKLKASDAIRLSNPQPIDFDEFENSIGVIING